MRSIPFFLFMYACEARMPEHVIVVCDGTGASPEDACTRRFLHQIFREWAQKEARYTPHSSFTVVTTGADTKGTDVAFTIEVPAKTPEGMHGWSAWVEAQSPAIGSIDIPIDENPGRNNVESNIVAAIRVAAEIAAADLAGEPTSLRIASDGLQIGEGVDLEGTLKIPFYEWNPERTRWKRPTLKPIDQVVPTLTDGPGAIDLSVFATIDVCGHHYHAELGQLQERERFWTLFFAAAHAPSPLPVFRTTCAGPTSPAPAPAPPTPETTP